MRIQPTVNPTKRSTRTTQIVRVAVPSLLIASLSVIAASQIVSAWSNSQIAPQTTTPDSPASDTQPAPLPSVTSQTNPILREVTVAIRENRVEEAKRLLKSLNVRKLEPTDARRWRSLASIAALRTGDRSWLDALTSDPEHFANSINLVTITAGRLLQDGRFAQARGLLETIEEPEKLDEIPRRRYLELWARLEQLENRPLEERKYINQLVSFASGWPSRTCQGCHSNPKKFGESVTTLNISEIWFGDRYVKLLQQQGDAQKVLVQAKKVLAKNPSDAAARLKLAYALRAIGQETKAVETLKTFSWAEFPDREKRPPMRFTTFP